MGHQTFVDPSGYTKTTIDFAGHFDLNGAIEFANTLYGLPPSHEFYLDFQNTKFVTPFGMLYLASHLRHIAKSTTIKLFVINYQHHSYLSHMGFFQSFGLNFGNLPGQASGSDTYVPVTTIPVQTFKHQSIGNQIGQHCEDEGQRLAKILLREDKSYTYQVISYSIRELLRNVVEHSDASEISYCAQFWPRSGRAEITVMDDGKGVWGGLSTNPNLVIKTHNEALNLSLLPGISGKMYKGVKVQMSNEWQNSGLGLYVTSKLCSDFGSFFIASGNSGIHISNGNKKQYYASLQGTVVRLVINTRKITQSSNTLIQEIVKEGKAREEYLRNCGTIQGDTASMMVTDEMKKVLKR